MTPSAKWCCGLNRDRRRKCAALSPDQNVRRGRRPTAPESPVREPQLRLPVARAASGPPGLDPERPRRIGAPLGMCPEYRGAPLLDLSPFLG